MYLYRLQFNFINQVVEPGSELEFEIQSEIRSLPTHVLADNVDDAMSKIPVRKHFSLIKMELVEENIRKLGNNVTEA